MSSYKEFTQIIYEQYEMIVECAGIPLDERWSFDEIFNQINDLMQKFRGLCQFMKDIDCDWLPSHMYVSLHYYGEKEEYFIDLLALIEEVIELENGLLDAQISFTIDTNDESLPSWGQFGNEEERIDRLINGDPDDDEDDKPWLR
jgi:hypothetical protein